MTVEIPNEIYSRVSGYYRPVKQFNKGKQEEFENRKYLDLPAPDAVPYRASTRNFNTR